MTDDRPTTAAAAVIERIAEVAEAFASAAGIGGMETAGSIVSYLSRHPEHIDAFIAGEASPIDWPLDWHEQGRLSWHALDGRIIRPETARRARLIMKMERGK